MAARVSWSQALAWRMRRQQLDPVGTFPVEQVVRRLCGVQAQVASSAELAVRVRRRASKPGEVGRAPANGRLIKTWAMRGTLHALTPEDGGAFLSLLAAGRSWERTSWQRSFGMTSDRWDLLRPAVREALDGAILTREELVAAIVERPGLEHLGEALRSGWGGILKPLAWQGDLCFGPSRGNRVTFVRPEAASARWAGIPEPDLADPVAIAAYLGTYGPATADGFGRWLSRGRVAARQLGRGSPRSATVSPRSRSTATPRPSRPRTSTRWRRRSPRMLCDCCRASTSTCSAPAPTTDASWRPVAERR